MFVNSRTNLRFQLEVFLDIVERMNRNMESVIDPFDARRALVHRPSPVFLVQPTTQDLLSDIGGIRLFSHILARNRAR
jgi:hypothetical protein